MIYIAIVPSHRVFPFLNGNMENWVDHLVVVGYLYRWRRNQIIANVTIDNTKKQDVKILLVNTSCFHKKHHTNTTHTHTHTLKEWLHLLLRLILLFCLCLFSLLCLFFPQITHWQSPHFHAYFPTSSSFPAMLGDMLSGGISCVGFSWVRQTHTRNTACKCLH